MSINEVPLYPDAPEEVSALSSLGEDRFFNRELAG